MSSSRREFLKRGTWMALGAGVPLVLTEKASAIGPSEASQGSGLTLAAFKSQLNTSFQINHQGSKIQLKLTDVTNLGSRSQSKNGKEGFSLLFRAPGETTLNQNTYLIEHEKLGVFSFLLVPVKLKNKSVTHYEAVVNRLYP